MPILRMDEIRKMTYDERSKKLAELRTELSKLKTMINAGGSVENPGRIKILRRTIGQILTVDSEELQKT